MCDWIQIIIFSWPILYLRITREQVLHWQTAPKKQNASESVKLRQLTLKRL